MTQLGNIHRGQAVKKAVFAGVITVQVQGKPAWLNLCGFCSKICQAKLLKPSMTGWKETDPGRGRSRAPCLLLLPHPLHLQIKGNKARDPNRRESSNCFRLEAIPTPSSSSKRWKGWNNSQPLDPGLLCVNCYWRPVWKSNDEPVETKMGICQAVETSSWCWMN